MKPYESIYNDNQIRAKFKGARKNTSYLDGETYDLWFWYIGDSPCIMKDTFAGRMPYESLEEFNEEWGVLSGDTSKA